VRPPSAAGDAARRITHHQPDDRRDHRAHRSLSLLHGAWFAERRNRGFTLCHASSGAPVARLRPTGNDDRFEVLYWSLWKERCASTGPFGRTILPIDDALTFIASEDIFSAIG
jgi:hypothetical protein